MCNCEFSLFLFFLKKKKKKKEINVFRFSMLIGITLIPRFIHRCMIILCRIISIPWFYLFYRARSLPFDEGYILSTKRKGFELLLFLKRKKFRINREMKLKKICCSIRNRMELPSHCAFTRLGTIQEYHHLDLVRVFRIFLSQNNF